MLVDPIRKRHFEVIEKVLSNKSGSNVVEFTKIQKNVTKKEACSLFLSSLMLKKAGVIDMN